MTRRRTLTGAVALFSLSLILPNSADAQTQDSSLQDIRASIIQAIGAESSSVEVSIRGNVFTVSRVNSTLNQTDHGTRNGEASKIGPVVSKALVDRPDFKNVHTIRVLYLARSKPNGTTKIVDTIDFRKAPGGGFVFHTT
jgi:hypothetical protein